MSPSVFQKGNTAVITGGASGIGLALARKCLASGMKVLVADYNDELLSQLDSAIIPIKMDVGKLDDWAALKTKVDAQFDGKISLLSLNAGTGPPTSFIDASSLPAFQAIISTNLNGVVYGIHTLLPLILSSPSSSPSTIIITGSKQGITNPPSNPAYNASKAAVKSLAEHLSFDLRDSQNISVHLLIPGWTYTRLTGAKAGGGEKPAGAWYPGQVIDYMVEKMAEGKFYIVCPDNDVTEEMDKKRILWAAGDVVEGRPPLTRWRAEWKGKTV